MRAREFFEEVRDDVVELGGLLIVASEGGDDWRGPGGSVGSCGVPDPTAGAAMYNVAVRRVALARINRRIGELTRTVGSALRMLDGLRGADPDAAAAIELRYVDARDEADSAEALGRSERHVRRLVNRGFAWIDRSGLLQCPLK
ncbi:hypothetical protein [Gordonibacter sp. Marseille-P4307]|uniref:hypothetical protein n=1 Tax=Gordonibacter sp. Marseille-P4307 TaxID=2161815 RepID=UPI000F52E249|nr:hypothetical protein [Gordonibacter sp. Marseille-P4307]